MLRRVATRDKCRQAVAFARRSDTSRTALSQDNMEAVHACSNLPFVAADRRGIAASALAQQQSYPGHTVLNFPSLSPTMSEGTLVQWNVKVGQEVTAGDVLAEVETDKATLGWENQDDGWVAKLLVTEGASGVGVGRPAIVLCDEEADVAKFADFVVEGEEAGMTRAAEAPEGTPEGTPEGAAPAGFPTAGINARMGPAARILMQEFGLDMARVVATGPRGVVTKEDVLEAVKSSGGSGAPSTSAAQVSHAQVDTDDVQSTSSGQPPAQGHAHHMELEENEPEYVDIPTTNMRKVIARRLLESKTTVPHMYASINVSLDNVLSMRKKLAAHGTKISVNDCVLRAVALALQQVPTANAFWDEAVGEVRPSEGVDVCVAVATEGGLYTPIVKDANLKSLSDISADVRRLATKAKENTLMPEEYVGGSFSVSNLGMFGVENFSAIINPPQGGILAVGGGRQVTRAGEDGELAVVTEMTVTLSADGRVYDGQTAGDFLEAFKANMEDPILLSIV